MHFLWRDVWSAAFNSHALKGPRFFLFSGHNFELVYYQANDSFLVAFHLRYRGSGTLNTHSRVILNRFATIIINHCICFRCRVSGVMGVWWWKVFFCHFFCHFAVGGWIAINCAKVEATRAKCFFAACAMTHFLWFRERRDELSFPGVFWVIIFSMHSCKSLFLPKAVHWKTHEKCQVFSFAH